MLQARWKSGAPAGEAKPEAARTGQIRKFRIAKLDPATKKLNWSWSNPRPARPCGDGCPRPSKPSAARAVCLWSTAILDSL